MSTKTGGPAFPTTQYANGISPSGHSEGITIRDYFAAKILQGLLADTNVNGSYKEFATRAYTQADAMLEARK